MTAVTIRQHGCVLVITLDRPKANAIDVATSQDFTPRSARLMKIRRCGWES